MNLLSSMVKQSASALSHRVISHTIMCFSNLVGPVEDIGFFGHTLAYLAPSSYGQSHVSIPFETKKKQTLLCL